MSHCVNIPFSAIEPFLRFAGIVPLSDSARPFVCVASDHRLLYCESGCGRICVSGTDYTFSPDDVLYLPAGTPYRICPDVTLRLLVFNFDFTQCGVGAARTLPLVSQEAFSPEQRTETVSFSDTTAFRAPLLLKSMPELRPYLQAAIYEATAAELLAARQQTCLFTVALNLIYRSSIARQSFRKENGSYRRILEYIQAHYQEELSNQRLSEVFNYHPNYINQIVLTQTGSSLHQYLLQIRIRKATQLLMTTSLSVAEIAEAVGFHNISYFSQYYRKCTGLPPSAARTPEQSR